MEQTLSDKQLVELAKPKNSWLYFGYLYFVCAAENKLTAMIFFDYSCDIPWLTENL